MSLGTKFLTGLPIVTGVSAYPLAVVTKNRVSATKLRVEMPPPAPILVPSPTISEPAKVQETIQKLFEKGYRDCTLISGYRGPGVLYVCSFLNTNGSFTPTFFYYDRRDTTRQVKDRFRKVTYISTQIGNRIMRLEDGDTINFQNNLYPFWMSKMDRELYPEQNCKIDKQGESSKLICKGHVMNQNERQ